MRKSLFMMVVIIAISGTAPSHAQETLDNYASHSVNGNQVNFVLSVNARVLAEVCKADIACIRLAVAGADFIANEPYIVVKYDWPPAEATVSEEGTYIKIATGEMVIKANKSPFTLDFYDAANTTAITTQSNDVLMVWD